MATTASNSSVILARQSEQDWGVKPGDETVPQEVDYGTQKFSSVSFTLNRAELEDDSITATRGISSVRYGNTDVSGSLSGNLAHNNFDDLFASAFMNDWEVNELVSDGSKEKSFTFEVGHTDIDQYEVWTGLQVGSVTVSSPTDGLSTVSFEFNGKHQESINIVPQDGTITPQASREAMFHCGGVIKYNGAPVAVITSVEFTVENGLENQFVWGDCSANDITYGKSRVSGSMTALYADAQFQSDSLNEADVSIDFTLTDPDGNSMTFYIPKAKLGSVDAPVDGEGASVLTIPFRGQYDETTGATVKITRS